MKKRTLLAWVFMLLFTAYTSKLTAQDVESSMPYFITNNGRYSLIVDGNPYLILGGQAHNSSAWPGMLPAVWDAIGTMHANTLEVPLYWEQIEPQPGKYDYSLIDTLLFQARERNVRLILLWFGTWKNGSNHYMPEWMKLDSKKYPNIIGKDGKYVDSPSPYCIEAMEADAKAFAGVMGHLKKSDPQHTVIMVQVQNEPGTWGSVRDFSPEAQKLINGQVPVELMKEDVLKALNKPVVPKGTWQEVFGEDADEYFHAWSVARYIEYVALVGKSVYPLPLYVNAALRDPISNPSANTYESGGPTDNVIPIWKAAARSISLLAPDIYLPESEKAVKVIELYSRKDNPLFIPEIGSGEIYVRYLYKALEHGAIGFSPFGVDDNGKGETDEKREERLGAIGREYRLIAPMAKEMATWAFEGKIKAIVEKEDHASQSIDLGNWTLKADFGIPGWYNIQQNQKPLGKVMTVKLGENEFLVIGSLCHITFKGSGLNEGKDWQYLRVEEGIYEDGKFKLLRIRNGDESDWGGPSIGERPVLLHIRLVAR